MTLGLDQPPAGSASWNHCGLVSDQDEAMKLLRDRVDETVNDVNSMSHQSEERDT